jgi:hypothetical protein
MLELDDLDGAWPALRHAASAGQDRGGRERQ